jgi:hypothetical protein
LNGFADGLAILLSWIWRLPVPVAALVLLPLSEPSFRTGLGFRERGEHELTIGEAQDEEPEKAAEGKQRS